MNIKILTLSIALLGSTCSVFAQESNDSTQTVDTGIMYLDPLFEYPIAPEELTAFNDKCNWLAENFWNPLDLKSKEAVDQAKLNHAFQVYASTVQYADKDKVTVSVDKLMKNLQKNPMLLFQITKAAEENIYGPRAEFWIDELYARILRAALANKKFPKTKRARYEQQLKQLDATMIGSTPAQFDFIRPNGDAAQYFAMATPTIIIFGDPDCDDCRMGKLKMQSNVAFSKAVTDGKINVLFIIPDPEQGWQAKMADFPKNMTVGASD
ncbi:MAG: DUF5106 domain-containing protein, partial [Muribaculaceae bacterium]|nr:DUF5106 domain-containing protein [Muribaculaceae bacterium]